MGEGTPVTKVLDCDSVTSRFELQWRFSVHFGNNNLGEKYEPPYQPIYKSNSTTADKKERLWH